MPAGAHPSPAGSSVLRGAGFDPQNANIPYLAWRGEQIRFVKCDTRINSTALNADLFVADWSGDPHNEPTLVPGSISIFPSPTGQIGCVRGNFFSDKPGFARIKLKVTAPGGNEVLVHEWLAAWMAIGSATLSPNATVSEPAGNAVFNNATVQVRGSVPLNREWQIDWGLGSGNLTNAGVCPANVDTSVFAGGAVCTTLPDDWATLAHALASLNDPEENTLNPTIEPWQYWDIHDSSAPAALGVTDTPDTHVSQTFCPNSAPSTTTDQVDNCQGGGENGVFSRVFGDGTNPTIGPFDPLRPDQTLLSDGVLNAADAPMPPLRIDVSSGGLSGTGPANTGAFVQADKHVIYSRNGLGSSTAHNLYAPFYSAYIPATSRPFAAASGTDGPTPGGNNNFNGYLVYGQYHFWNFARILSNATAQNTNCLLRFVNGQPIFRQTLSGPQSVAVYTDEHGEAIVTWSPGLNNSNFADFVLDDNGACDIEGLNLGGARITAVARYPQENVAAPFPVSGVLTKNVNNLFSKTISCRLKNNGPRGGLVYICTASARDINGSGAIFQGEQVCISREPFGTVYSNPQGTLNGPLFGQPGEACVPLTVRVPGGPAIAEVETPATLVGTNLDVSAYFSDELIWRDTCIVVGQPGPSGPGPCGAATAPSPGPESGPTPQPTGPPIIVVSAPTVTSTVASATGGTTSQGSTTTQTNQSKTQIKAAVVSVRVVATRTGRALMVKVQSPKKLATIRIVLVGKHGKVVARLTRIVKTNKEVRVSHVLVPKSVKAVRVSLLR